MHRRSQVSDIRRVVTGHDDDGRAVVLFDGAPPRSVEAAGGIGRALFWISTETPADNSGSADGGDLETGIPPPPGGSIFRVVEFPPQGDDPDDGGMAEQAHLKKSGARIKGDDGLTARHPGMHKTDTIDYAIIISGEIDMLLDDTEVHLKPGDVVVQRGTYHAWVNRGDEPCRIAFVLIDAKPAP